MLWGFSPWYIAEITSAGGNWAFIQACLELTEISIGSACGGLECCGL